MGKKETKYQANKQKIKKKIKNKNKHMDFRISILFDIEHYSSSVLKLNIHLKLRAISSNIFTYTI